MASFSVVSNLASAAAQTNLQNTNINLNKALTRLSSGFRINNAGDDAAGLAVANTYRNNQAILSQGVRNANDAMSKLQIKDGALNNISTLLDRLATLATQASSTSNGADIGKLSVWKSAWLPPSGGRPCRVVIARFISVTRVAQGGDLPAESS